MRPPGPGAPDRIDGTAWDVVVVGAGNAALVAAIAAAEGGSRVLVLERAPVAFRGGNTRHTRNIRCVHAAADDFYHGSYLFDEMWRDLCGVGEGPSNEKLADLTVRLSEEAVPWLSAHGVRWQAPLHGTLQLGRTNRFFLGGGKALVNAHHRTLRGLGITVAYEATVEELLMDGDRCVGLRGTHLDAGFAVSASAVVCASGGFEANIEWLRRYWGDAADNYIIRGPKYNDGQVLAALYALGAGKAGQERGFHAIAVDARAPRFDGGIATRLDMIPFGVVLNQAGERFYDEGEDIWPKRYAVWGRNIAQQPSQIAYALWDERTAGMFLPPMYGVYRGSSVADLAAQLGLPPDRVVATVDGYNAGVRPGTFNPSVLDDCRTEGVHPPKSHWAQPIDRAPFYGIPMRPGITFTYLGVAVNENARVLRTDGTPFANVYAAGEIMSGNILSTGYLAGFGLTIGTVWGRIAGTGAAQHAR
jgi:tricarballylate dehydrogenase